MSTTSPADSLVELAARKQLPHHQYTDSATVRWIAANRPDFSDGPPPPLRETSQTLLPRTALPAAWFAEAECLESLHGIRHAMRTAALAALLAEAVGLGDDDTSTLVLAAAVHDCRRLHDKDDPGHGARAAIWLTDNADTVWDHFGLIAAPQRIDAAATAVRLHNIPYNAFTEDDHSDHARTEAVCDLLKAADALDRFRLPKLTWWPDPAQVRVDAFNALRPTAFDLVVHSENAWLTGVSGEEAVLGGLARLGLTG